MLTDVTAVAPSTATRSGEIDTPPPLSPEDLRGHRNIHPRPQHGCHRCPPTPCVCGHNDGTCPDAFEHRRAHAGAETTWRETAR